MFCATLGVLLTAPAWVVLPLVIKLEDGGPVFFGQERVGRGGTPFKSWKFRSMTPREHDDGLVVQSQLEVQRVTRVGRIMRPMALDELPQLLNILRGDMSLVGPRALAPVEVVADTDAPILLRELPGFEERHSVRPGLTGLAQTRLPPDAPHRLKFRYDLVYVRRRTLRLDMWLIGISVLTSLRGAWPDVGQPRCELPDARRGPSRDGLD